MIRWLKQARVALKQQRHITKTDLPDALVLCPQSACVYNVSGICGEIDESNILQGMSTNHGNGDAQCHTWRPRRILDMLVSHYDKR